MAEPAVRRYTLAEYHAIEAETDVRHEYLDGEVMERAEGTIAHAMLCGATIDALSSALRDQHWKVFPSELKVHSPQSGLHTYPDVTVVGGPIEVAEVDENAVTNPMILCEVLSPETEAWDRGEKFDHYKQIPTLKDYVLVASDRRAIDHYTRNDDGTWTLRSAGPGDTLRLLAHDVAVAVDDIYAGVELAAPPKRRLGRGRF